MLQNDESFDARAAIWLRAHLLPSLAVGVLLLALLALLVARVALGRDEPALVGTDLGKKPAPDFSLTDQRGQTVSLSDFRGQTVVLTFIGMDCPELCPVTALVLKASYELLPEGVQEDVVLLAVTIDPERDTREVLQAFTATHNLADNPNWFALQADRVTLESVWAAYGIYPGRNPSTPGAGGPSHTDAIYLIDPESRERVLLRTMVAPQTLADNLETLVD